jgi:hypothetical protein
VKTWTVSDPNRKPPIRAKLLFSVCMSYFGAYRATAPEPQKAELDSRTTGLREIEGG